MQFSLRALLLFTALVAAGLGIYSWHERQLVTLVGRFNTAMDAHDFDAAHAIAQQALVLYPENIVVESMNWKAKFAIRLSRGLKPPDGGGFECY